MNWTACESCGGRPLAKWQHCPACNKDGKSTMLSETMKSCLFTATTAGRKVPQESHTVPDLETRRLCAKLIFEEVMETITALGFGVMVTGGRDGEVSACVTNHSAEFLTNGKYDHPDLEKIIDGCCDTIYVATYCLALSGVPDTPHMQEVCAANDRKFPGGKMTPHPSVVGKFGKPPGWAGPDHKRHMPEREV